MAYHVYKTIYYEMHVASQQNVILHQAVHKNLVRMSYDNSMSAANGEKPYSVDHSEQMQLTRDWAMRKLKEDGVNLDDHYWTTWRNVAHTANGICCTLNHKNKIAFFLMLKSVNGMLD